MEKLTEKAGLRYVNDNEPGYTRKRWGRGFTYIDDQGTHITDENERKRLIDLVIPPAWTDVWICPSADGHIQVTGRDEKGRKQYIYHSAWEEARNKTKFNSLLRFGESLPELRLKVAEDLRRHKLSQEVLTALIIRLLDETLLRIGNTSYAETNGSYGLTTLQNEHIEIEGTRVTFSFPGKGGKEQEVSLRDRRMAQLVERCQELPGQHLFQYFDEEGGIHSISSTDVNAYLQEHTGEAFTAKLFRTWGATVTAAEILAELEPPQTKQEAQKGVVEAVKSAARVLGNTPAICRQYYVHPAIIAAYESGELASVWEACQEEKLPHIEGLSPIETAVLHLLKSLN